MNWGETQDIRLPQGTFSVGYGGSGSSPAGVRGGRSWNIDQNGDILILGGGGGGGWTNIGLDGGLNFMITDSPNVDNLEGDSVQFGVNFDVLVNISVELVIFSNEKGEAFHGINIFTGGGVGLMPISVHGSFERDEIIVDTVNIMDTDFAHYLQNRIEAQEVEYVMDY